MSNTSNASKSRSHPLSSVTKCVKYFQYCQNNSMLFWDYRRWSIKGFTPNKSIYLSYNTLTQLNLSVIDKEFMILPRTRAVLVLDAVIHYQQKINSLQQNTPLQFSLACCLLLLSLWVLLLLLFLLLSPMWFELFRHLPCICVLHQCFQITNHIPWCIHLYASVSSFHINPVLVCCLTWIVSIPAQWLSWNLWC